MTYDDAFDEAVEQDQVEAAVVRIFKFTEPDQRVTGELLAISEFEDGQYDQAANQYLVDTDSGPVSFVLGGATDDRITDELEVGDLMRVTYHGQKELPDGRTVNDFDVQRVPAGEWEGGGE